MSQDLVLENVVISYPTLFVPKQINGKGDPKFSATLILPANFDWGRVQAAAQEAITAKFGASVPANLRMPWKDATEDGFPGQFKVNAYSDRAIQVVDQQVQPVMDQNQIFAGCIVNAYIRLYGYPNNGGGVAAGLNIIQIVNNTTVTRLDNAKSAKEVFQPIAGAPPPLAAAPAGYAPQPGAPVQQNYAPQPGAVAPPGYAAPQPTPGPTPGPVPGTPQGYAPQPGQPPAPGAPVAQAPGAQPPQPWNQ